MQRKNLNIHPVPFRHLMQYQTFLFLLFAYFGLVFFFLAAQLAAFQFPDQGLNPGCSSETPKS